MLASCGPLGSRMAAAAAAGQPALRGAPLSLAAAPLNLREELMNYAYHIAKAQNNRTPFGGSGMRELSITARPR